MNERALNIPIPEGENEKEKYTRREVMYKGLRNGLALGVATAIAPSVLTKLIEYGYDEEEGKEYSEKLKQLVDELHKEHAEDAREEIAERIKEEYWKEMEDKTLLSQIKELGEIRDLQVGIQAIFEKDYKYYTKTGKGKNDLLTAVQNMSKLDMNKIAQPYQALGLPKELSYMIAIQETRGRNLTSSAGAVGITQLKPSTIESMGFKEEDAKDPYKASSMSANYFATERDERFGKDMDLLLHAYNAGGNLFGYTDESKRKKYRNCNDFYKYMQDYLNEKFKDVVEKGYYLHTLDEDDKSIKTLSARFQVPAHKIVQANGFTKKTRIHKGDEIKIPYDDMTKAMKIISRKPLQALRYTPQVKAKYQALRDLGLTESIELAMND